MHVTIRSICLYVAQQHEWDNIQSGESAGEMDDTFRIVIKLHPSNHFNDLNRISQEPGEKMCDLIFEQMKKTRLFFHEEGLYSNFTDLLPRKWCFVNVVTLRRTNYTSCQCFCFDSL